MRDGFVKVAAGTPKIRVADCIYNADRIVELIRAAAALGVKVLALPELCLTGYTCGDLFFQDTLLDAAERELATILAETADLDVLTAKVQALLRRTYDFGAAAPLLEARGAVLDTGDNSLTYEGQKLELTRNEYRMLQVLLEQKGRTVSRETLMQRLWETDSFVDENTLTVNMARLRRKLEGLGLTEFIRTKKGLGYLIE